MESYKGGFWLDNICSTFLSDHLVIFYDQKLIYIDSKTGKIIFQKNFDSIQEDINSIEYFLSPTYLTANSLINLTPIKDTDNIISLNNLNNLMLFIFQKDKNIENRIVNSPNKMKFDSGFKLDQRNLVLLAFDVLNSQLIGFDMQIIMKQKAFKDSSILFQIDFKSQPTFYSIDTHFLFTIENKKILQVFKYDKEFLNNYKLIGKMAMYAEIFDCTISSNEYFICLAMEDRRMVSFLIDHEPSITRQKLKSLPSR